MNLLAKLNKVFLRKKSSSSFAHLNKRLEERRLQLTQEFSEKNEDVRDWLAERGINPEELVSKGSRGVLAGVAAGMLMLSVGLAKIDPPTQASGADVGINKIVGEVKAKKVVDKDLVERLGPILPKKVRKLNLNEEKDLTNSISQLTGINAVAELDGNRLNTNYGLIGLEQHLPRYPGDTIASHFDSTSARNTYGKTGMTRNRGAFGYFAPSKKALTTEGIEKEKYYVVVQTFDSPGWGKKKGLVEWYKHRKVLVVNPKNGKAVVGNIADSGPAKFTKKSFGGSPEVMHNLGLYGGMNKGAVLLFFIDDPENKVKLGPI